MPRFDGTGPDGVGSKTGRGAGICELFDKSDDMTILERIRFSERMRCPRRMGRRNRFGARGMNY